MLEGRVNNLVNNDVNNLTIRLSDVTNRVETTLEGNYNGLLTRVANIENLLPNLLRKSTPLPAGYNPYVLTATVTANAWMYNITPVDVIVI